MVKVICNGFTDRHYKRVGVFCNIKDCSPLPGQKAPRTRRREGRKEKTKKSGHRLSLINTEVKDKKKGEKRISHKATKGTEQNK